MYTISFEPGLFAGKHQGALPSRASVPAGQIAPHVAGAADILIVQQPICAAAAIPEANAGKGHRNRKRLGVATNQSYFRYLANGCLETTLTSLPCTQM